VLQDERLNILADVVEVKRIEKSFLEALGSD
jgi:hypothetical protein